jgi:signal transduction histidine kinase
VNDGIGIAETVLQQVRNMSLDLRPSLLDDLGLVAALRWYADRQAQRAGMVVNVAVSGFPARLPTEIETTCFRVTQEALTNIVRHAGARHVDVVLQLKPASTNGDGTHRDEVELTIRDDGVGFDVRQARQDALRGGSLGLLGMEERVFVTGGSMVMTSTPGASAATRGTTIRATFPVESRPVHSGSDFRGNGSQ